MGPHDFKGKTYDGATDDWPISYDDVKPYYDKVDRLIGLYGTVEGLENEPDGIFLPPPKPRLNELLIMKAGKKAGVKVIPGRGSVLTQQLPVTKIAEAVSIAASVTEAAGFMLIFRLRHVW